MHASTMHASDLIRLLQDFTNRHGDLPVVLQWGNAAIIEEAPLDDATLQLDRWECPLSHVDFANDFEAGEHDKSCLDGQMVLVLGVCIHEDAMREVP